MSSSGGDVATSGVGAAPRDCPREVAVTRGRKSVHQPEEVSRPRRGLRKQLDPGPGVHLSQRPEPRRLVSDKGHLLSTQRRPQTRRGGAGPASLCPPWFLGSRKRMLLRRFLADRGGPCQQRRVRIRPRRALQGGSRSGRGRWSISRGSPSREPGKGRPSRHPPLWCTRRVWAAMAGGCGSSATRHGLQAEPADRDRWGASRRGARSRCGTCRGWIRTSCGVLTDWVDVEGQAGAGLDLHGAAASGRLVICCRACHRGVPDRG